MATLTSFAPAGPVAARSPRARRYTVRLETDSGIYVGKLYVPHGKGRVSDVIADERPFLNLTEVTHNDGLTVESYVAVNKRHIHTLRVVDEGVEEAAGG
jgi:hypothetical protein